MNFIVSAVTDIGLTKKNNQDSCSVRLFHTKQGKIVFAVLCDGMGGLAKGEVASASLINAFNTWSVTKLPKLCEDEITDWDIRNDWTAIITECNEKIKVYGRKLGAAVGTTLTVILLTSKRYYMMNVGDTRAYEITDVVSRLTKDQTVVAREVELGILTEEEAKHDSRRSVLLQCIGASEEVYPDMYFGDTKQDAVYMLCSDGFIHEITENEIYSYLNPKEIISENAMKRNGQALIELNKQRGERDNISVITVRTY